MHIYTGIMNSDVAHGTCWTRESSRVGSVKNCPLVVETRRNVDYLAKRKDDEREGG